MSYLLKAVAIFAAISLGIVASQILPGGAEDKPDRSAKKPEAAPGDEPAESRPLAKPRGGNLPLSHAILRDEKDDDSAEARIIRTLAKPTTVEFLDLPLEDCMTFLKEYHNVNVWIDRGTLTDAGVALDQPITLKLAGVTLESVLHLLLEPAQLDWLVQDEVLKITTKSWADKHPETRTYDIHNLIEAGHKHEDLIAAITKCIEPASWSGKDAAAGISHTGGVLVIRQSQRVHSDIAHLLEELDTIADMREDGDSGKEAKTASLKVRRIY
jgi:hypothetical protein